jgi:hypothetical protein
MKRLGLALWLATAVAQGQPAQGPPAANPPERCEANLGEGPPSVLCFDPGHRLYLSGGTAGLGWGIQLRHLIRTDDPGLHWRSEHGLLRGTVAADRFRGAVYEGRFLRHSREGYLLLPTSPPRRIPVPFDVGLETSVGRLEGRLSSDEIRMNAVRGALLLDFARSDTFRRRAALGAVARWDLLVDRRAPSVREQAIAPFSVGLLSLYAESASGLTLAQVQAEAGYATLGRGSGWRPVITVELTVERVLLALNDLPLSVYAAGRHDEPGEGFRAELGLRWALLSGRR